MKTIFILKSTTLLLETMSIVLFGMKMPYLIQQILHL